MADQTLYIVTLYHYDCEPQIVGVYDDLVQASEVKQKLKGYNCHADIGCYNLNETDTPDIYETMNG